MRMRTVMIMRTTIPTWTTIIAPPISTFSPMR